jgi:hypothetical protein
MCKINGHSIFSYLTQPWNAQKLYTSNARNKAVQKAQTEATENIAKNSDGDEISETASTAKMNTKKKKDRTLSSLRVPLESNNVGASVGSGSSLGLNLGG